MYSALPLDSHLAITLWDVSPEGGKDARGHHVPFGGTTLPLFDRQDNQLQRGRQKCFVHRGRIADGNENTTTPAVPSADSKKKGKGSHEQPVFSKEVEELNRMEKLFKKHEMGEIPKVDWLDQLVFRGFERRGPHATKPALGLAQAQPQTPVEKEANGMAPDPNERPGPSRFLLNVELPRFDFPIVFADHEYPPPPVSSHPSASQSSTIAKPPPQVQLGPGIDGLGRDEAGRGLIHVYDPEVGARDNPAESKHRRLVRSQHRHHGMDKDLKPNAKVRDELKAIVAYSPAHPLTPEEKDLVWKFRYHLSKDKRALTKFVKSVNWSDQAESRQAVQMLSRWTEIDVDDALELLGPTFDNAAVRAYAVERLRKADDDELLLYLLQLVQALKFEHIAVETAPAAGGDAGAARKASSSIADSSLARFLISRAADNFMLGNYFYWYLMVECDDRSQMTAARGAEHRKMYARVAYDFMTELVQRPGGEETRRVLLHQAELVAILSKISGDIKMSHESIAKKTERVKQFLADPKNELVSIQPPLPLPLDPAVKVVGVIAEETVVFKSSLSPIKVVFRTADGGRYPILFKTGDDLRQDQLVVQIIMLMDRLLQKENLDLRLSPYKILATSTTAGMSQFVPSASLQSILSRYHKSAHPALAYLRQHANASASGRDGASGATNATAANSNDPTGLPRETLETFIRSCAGYCVITYILGVGDRHLDNLLLTPDGRFFHADFGFILGRDPKPFAPVMKLSKEMVDVMGGVNSEGYARFRQFCFLAYQALRKSSGLVLSLFGLMVDADIPDIRIEPDKAVQKVKDRFRLDLDDGQAVQHFDRVIDDSLNALVPVVIDRLHEFVQAFRT